MSRQPETNQGLVRKLRQQKRTLTRLANSTPYALSGTSVVAPGLTKVDERIVAGTPGGSRVELDSAGLRKYAADGTTVQVDLTGDVAAFSGLITGSEIIAGTAGAARLELDAAGLRQYAADGTTVLLDTADDATIRVRDNNTAFGTSAQQALTTGMGNTAVGPNAQQALTTGWSNAAVGSNAQQALTTGSANTAIGDEAQLRPLGIIANATTTAADQTSIGAQAGQSSATQVDAITTIGYRATAGAHFAISIGAEARADHAGSIALGYQTLTTQQNQVMVGPRDVEITDTTKGLVLVSPDGTRTRITAANGDSLLVNGTAIGGGSGSPLFADPNTDKLVFWDDSAGAFAPLNPANGLILTGTDLMVRLASDTQTGIVELATSAETITGTDTARAVTPAGVKAAVYAPGAAGTGVSYSAGWADYGAGNALVTWYKDKDGYIRMSGTLKRTGATVVAGLSGVIFTLPIGARPAGTTPFLVNKDEAAIGLLVYADGTVQIYSPASAWTGGSSYAHLGAVMFRAA